MPLIRQLDPRKTGLDQRAPVVSRPVRPAPGVLQRADTTRQEMFDWDWVWLEHARWTDARICLAGDVRPYKRGSCGSDPICNWGFYNVQLACGPLNFESVLFQGPRYEWAQRRLREMLANKPPSRRVEHVDAWVDWTIEVLRLVSLARWTTNISTDYLAPGPRAVAKATEIAGWQPGPGVASKRDPRDLVVNKNLSVISLWTPRDFNHIRYPAGAPTIPRQETDFDPVREYDFGTVIQAAPSHQRATWPWRWIPQSPGGSLRAQMRAWFLKTLSAGYWFKEPAALIRYGTADCGGVSLVGHCYKESRFPFWYGTAFATIEMAEAWAQDVIERSYGDVVADSLDAFLQAYLAVPPSMRVLTNANIADIRDAIQETAVRETMAGLGAAFGAMGAIAGAVNAAAGVVVAVAAAVLGILLEILRATNALAIGGAVLERACIASPLVRMIKSDTTNACDFDIRGGERSAEAAVRAVAQLDAVRQAAAAEMPVRAWFDASKRAAGEGDVSELFYPAADQPPPGGTGTGTPWTPYLVAAGLIVGGAAVYRLTQK